MTSFDLTPEGARRALQGDAAATALSDDAVRERYATVIWNHVTEPGDGVAGRLVQQVGAVRALRAVMAPDAATGHDLTAKEFADGLKRWVPRVAPGAVAVSLRIAATRGITILTRADDAWPAQLNDLREHAPLCLWVRGDPQRLRALTPSVALVGARAATSYGEHVARELSAGLVGAGIPVVSGGAYGIDGAAHHAALASGGLTVALMAGGAERAYPVGHTRLLDDIAEQGVVASEAPCGGVPTKWRFLQRNRLIAALSSATVVVEAGWRSGSLNTAAHAVTLNRPLGAVPGPITSAGSSGTHKLMREFGAQCITSADDIRELLQLSGVRPAAASDDDRPVTDDATRVRDALSMRSWRDAGDVARRAGMAHSDVEVILGLLSLGGEVERQAGAWRRIRQVMRE